VLGNILTPTHLILVLTAALLVLGPKRLPAAGRGLGEALRSFKEAIAPDQHPDPTPITSAQDAQPEQTTITQ
jgi:sec-independent protein translocase protein TatA